jgi:hypothetical protein
MEAQQTGARQQVRQHRKGEQAQRRAPDQGAIPVQEQERGEPFADGEEMDQPSRRGQQHER